MPTLEQKPILDIDDLIDDILDEAGLGSESTVNNSEVEAVWAENADRMVKHDQYVGTVAEMARVCLAVAGIRSPEAARAMVEQGVREYEEMQLEEEPTLFADEEIESDTPSTVEDTVQEPEKNTPEKNNTELAGDAKKTQPISTSEPVSTPTPTRDVYAKVCDISSVSAAATQEKKTADEGLDEVVTESKPKPLVVPKPIQPKAQADIEVIKAGRETKPTTKEITVDTEPTEKPKKLKQPVVHKKTQYAEAIDNRTAGQNILPDSPDSTLLDSRKIPTTPDPSAKRSTPVSSLDIAMATPLSDNRTCSSLLNDSGRGEVLRQSSLIPPEIFESDTLTPQLEESTDFIDEKILAKARETREVPAKPLSNVERLADEEEAVIFRSESKIFTDRKAIFNETMTVRPEEEARISDTEILPLTPPRSTEARDYSDPSVATETKQVEELFGSIEETVHQIVEQEFKLDNEVASEEVTIDKADVRELCKILIVILGLKDDPKAREFLNTILQEEMEVYHSELKKNTILKEPRLDAGTHERKRSMVVRVAKRIKEFIRMQLHKLLGCSALKLQPKEFILKPNVALRTL